jgi:hypothetical protein
MDKWHAHNSRILTEDGRFVALVMGREFTIAEHREHTRLLAAAPELLEACKSLLVAIDQMQLEWDGYGMLAALDCTIYDKPVKRAKAAIAKASKPI